MSHDQTSHPEELVTPWGFIGFLLEIEAEVDEDLRCEAILEGEEVAPWDGQVDFSTRAD